METPKYTDHKFSNDFIKKHTVVSSIGLLSFFLPWISIELGGTISATGYDLLPDEGFSILYLIPIGFIANIIFVNIKKEELFYIRTLVFLAPLILMFIRIKDVYSFLSIYDHKGEFREVFSELIKLPTYGFYLMLICVIVIHLISYRTDDPDDPDFGEI